VETLATDGLESGLEWRRLRRHEDWDAEAEIGPRGGQSGGQGWPSRIGAMRATREIPDAGGGVAEFQVCRFLDSPKADAQNFAMNGRKVP